MRRLLASLLCFVLLESQVFAIWGLGISGTAAGQAVTGTWSGTLIPTGNTPNTLGIFSFVTPDSGFSTGAAFVFNNGQLFQGSIVGVMDSGQESFDAILHLVHVTAISSTSGGFAGNSTSLSFDSSADGLINANIFVDKTQSVGLGLNGSASTQVVNYTNNYDVNGNFTGTTATPGGTFDFEVDGFLQSASTTTTSGNNVASLLSGLGSGTQ